MPLLNVRISVLAPCPKGGSITGKGSRLGGAYHESSNNGAWLHFKAVRSVYETCLAMGAGLESPGPDKRPAQLNRVCETKQPQMLSGCRGWLSAAGVSLRGGDAGRRLASLRPVACTDSVLVVVDTLRNGDPGIVGPDRGNLSH
ncbi:hypothetical protein TgHK011_001945 [Trichoderma gracile]|nr:hypothetical protein TgHK011_001945 [Trichoderma gracile]